MKCHPLIASAVVLPLSCPPMPSSSSSHPRVGLPLASPFCLWRCAVRSLAPRPGAVVIWSEGIQSAEEKVGGIQLGQARVGSIGEQGRGVSDRGRKLGGGGAPNLLKVEKNLAWSSVEAEQLMWPTFNQKGSSGLKGIPIS